MNFSQIASCLYCISLAVFCDMNSCICHKLYADSLVFNIAGIPVLWCFLCSWRKSDHFSYISRKSKCNCICNILHSSSTKCYRDHVLDIKVSFSHLLFTLKIVYKIVHLDSKVVLRGGKCSLNSRVGAWVFFGRTNKITRLVDSCSLMVSSSWYKNGPRRYIEYCQIDNLQCGYSIAVSVARKVL